MAGSQLLGIQAVIGACKRCAVCLAAHCGTRVNLAVANCGATMACTCTPQPMTMGTMAVLLVRHALVGFG